MHIGSLLLRASEYRPLFMSGFLKDGCKKNNALPFPRKTPKEMAGHEIWRFRPKTKVSQNKAKKSLGKSLEYPAKKTTFVLSRVDRGLAKHGISKHSVSNQIVTY